MVKVCRLSFEDCRGCGQAGQGPACQILQMGGVGEMLSVRYCQILQIIAPTSNSPAVSGQQGRMFASDPVRFYNQSPPEYEQGCRGTWVQRKLGFAVDNGFLEQG